MSVAATARRRKRVNPLQRAERRQAIGFISPALLGLAVFTVLPVGLAIVMSVYDWPIFGEREFIGLGNYAELLSKSPDFWPSLRNSFLFALGYVPLNLVISLGLALMLSARIRGRAIFRVLFFIPVVTPMVANAMVWRLMLQPAGPLNGISEAMFGITLPNFLVDKNWAMISIIVMSVWAGMGYNMLIFTAALEQVPASVIEAAELDGAHGFTMLWRIVLPMISPSVFFASVMTIISALQVFTSHSCWTNGGPGHEHRPAGDVHLQHRLQVPTIWVWPRQRRGCCSRIIISLTAVLSGPQSRWVHYEH